MTSTYFKEPTQLMFYVGMDEGSNAGYCAGIGFHDYIICAVCGHFELTSEVEARALGENKKPFYFYNTWRDVNEEIIGGALPEAMRTDDSVWEE